MTTKNLPQRAYEEHMSDVEGANFWEVFDKPVHDRWKRTVAFIAKEIHRPLEQLCDQLRASDGIISGREISYIIQHIIDTEVGTNDEN